MIINYAFTSNVLPKAILLDPVRFIDYYKIQSPFIDCPAIQDLYKNVFVIPMPLDFYCEFNIINGEITFQNSNLNERFISIFCDIGGNLDLQFKPLELTYWADESCVAEAWGPSISKLINIGGCFDIKKWIRPIHPAYIIPNKNIKFTLDYKKGDPWLFVKFNSDKKINLKYNYDMAVLEEASKMSESTSFVSGLKKYFKKFDKIRPRKLTK